MCLNTGNMYKCIHFLRKTVHFFPYTHSILINIKKRQIGLMKSSGLMQLTVQVGTCTIPQLPYLEYSLTVRIPSPTHEKDIAASTTFKSNEGSEVNFATKLFLKIEKGTLEQTPNCCIIVTGINQKSSRCQVARGEAKTCGEGVQRVRMKVVGREECWVQAGLEFSTSIWQVKQTKSNNNRMSNFKSQLSQKQSSSEQKQSHPSKISTSFTHNEHPTQKQKSADTHSKPTSIVKESKSEKILPELEKSTVTTKESGKNQQHTVNKSDCEELLAMQIKIDHLQQKIAVLGQELRIAHHKTKEAQELAELEHRQRTKLEESKEQLSELLILEEEKNNICLKHIERLNKLIETLSNPQESEFALIEEKDEIILLNEELEKEITNKNITINQMKNQIQELQDKIISFESIKLRTLPQHPQPPKIVISSNKIITAQKPKVEKRSSQRNVPLKKQEISMTAKAKDAKKVKQKQFKQKEVKDPKLDVNSAKKPAIPKNPREVKSPIGAKNEASLSLRGKPKAAKLKVEQKATMQTQKPSHMQQSMHSMGSLSSTNNLMINSRMQEVVSK